MPHAADNKPEVFKEPLEPDGYSTTDSPVIEAKVQGDVANRLVLQADGTILTGDGTAAPTTVGPGANSVETGDIVDEAVTLGKMADLARGSLIVGATASNRPTALDANDSGKILVGDGTDLASVAVSGDATLAANGALTIANEAVTVGKMADLTLGSYLVGGASDRPTAQTAADTQAALEAAAGRVYYGSGAFVPAADGTYPGYNLGGLSYDKATEEKAAISLLVPAAWNTCDIYIICVTPAASNDVRLTTQPFGASPVTVTAAITGSFATNRVRVLQDQAVGAGPFYDITGTAKAFTTTPLIRNGDDVLDTLDDDLVVLFVELVKVT